jgi:hypothetical protein
MEKQDSLLDCLHHITEVGWGQSWKKYAYSFYWQQMLETPKLTTMGKYMKNYLQV